MHQDRIKDSDMLSKYRSIGLAISELALMLIYGAVALVGYGALTSETTHGQERILALSDIRVALLMSGSFMVLSGYVVSVVLFHVLYTYRQSWTRRAVVNGCLFLVHVAIFAFLVGSSPFSLPDLPLVLFGVAGVVVAEATASIFWKSPTMTN